MRKYKTTTHRLLMVAVAFLVGIIISQIAFAQTPKPLKIGVILPLTGIGALPATHAKNALLLGKEQFERESGIPIELHIEDSRTDSKSAVSAYNKLATVENVDAVIGDLWDFLTVPLIPLSKRHSLVTVSPTLMDVASTTLGESEFFWTLGSKVSSLDGATQKFLSLYPGKTKIGIFCWNNYWGEAHLGEWRKVIASNKLSITAEKCEGDFSSDLRGVALTLHRSKPDLMIASTLIGTFAKRLSELHSKAPVLATSDMLEELNNPGMDTGLLEGWFFTQWEDPKDFVEQYHRRFGIDPQHEASKSFYALKALVEATRVRGPNQSLADVLRSTKILKSDGDTIDFSRHPFANETTAKLFVVKKGEVEEVL